MTLLSVVTWTNGAQMRLAPTLEAGSGVEETAEVEVEDLEAALNQFLL
jgi:hypothetical protein